MHAPICSLTQSPSVYWGVLQPHTHTHTRPPILATPDVHPDATTIFLYVTIWPAEACRFSHTSAYTLPHCFKAQVCLRLCVRVCLYAYVYGMLIRQGDNWWRGMLADVVCVCVCVQWWIVTLMCTGIETYTGEICEMVNCQKPDRFHLSKLSFIASQLCRHAKKKNKIKITV